MTFQTPLGLLVLLAVPAVIALHLFRRRLVERRVAGLFLFRGERIVASSGRKRTRLLNTLSLWLECLAAAVLALWLGGLSFGGAVARHVVFVLDDSASMGVGSAVASARAEIAKRAADLASGDRATLLCTGPRPTVLLGPRALLVEILSALALWRPVQRRHDPLPALDLARELAAGTGEVVFCTDEEPPSGCSDITVMAFGASAPNCSIVTAQRLLRASGDGEDLRVGIAAHGAVAATELTVRSGDQMLQRVPVAFAEGQAQLVLSLPAGVGALTLALAGDAMSIDDVAWLLPPPERTVAVCELLPAEQREGLQLQRMFGALRGFRHESNPLQAQLVLAQAPGQLRAGQTEVVFAPGDGERDAWRGPFVIDRAHEWMAGLHLDGVVWLAGRRALPGHVLIAAGAQALATEEFVDAGRRLWLTLDASAGNLMRSPDWPVLFLNLLETARAEVPGVETPNVQIGDEARFRRSMVAGATDAQIWWREPDGTRTAAAPGRTVGFVPRLPGLHEVIGADGAVLGRFAARFVDPSESDLRGLVTKTWPAAVRPPETAGTTRDTSKEQQLLAMLLLALMLADWWWLGRRSP
jgi:hypothetical protein